MNSNRDSRICQSIYQTLLECRQGRDIPSTAFIREFFETSRCDAEVDFSPFREEYVVRLNKDDDKRLQRILNFKETSVDEMVATQACIHYATWHHKQLVSALSWPNWFAYHTVDRVERTLIAFQQSLRRMLNR